MPSKIKVSVVVPVYNQEKYLRQCVDSIVSQTLKEIEIILVDDGSTDSSPSICDEYAAKDTRVKVIHKENAGMGAAYNTGMKLAKGEYIGFVESDDWIEPKMYEKLYTVATKENVDVVKSLFSNVRGGVKQLSRQYGNPYDNRYMGRRCENVLKTVPILAYGHYSTWSAIYRQAFIKEKAIEYPERKGASMGDIDFHWRTYTQVKSFYLLGESFYNYRLDNPLSSVNQGYKTAMESFHAFHETFEWLLKHKTQNSYIELIFRAIYLSARHHNEKNCHVFEKISHAKALAKAYACYISQMKFSYFREHEKNDFLHMLRHPYLYAVWKILYHRHETPLSICITLGGIKLFEEKKTPQSSKTKLLYFPVKKVVSDGRESRISYFGVPMVSKREEKEVVKSSFLGIRYSTKKVIKPLRPYTNEVRLLQVLAHANTISNTHQKTFTKYKNCHVGKDVILVATGPTLNYFRPHDNCIYVGVNKAVAYDQLQFDYLFFQDYAHNQSREILELMGKCERAEKFYGILQETVGKRWIIPESVAIRHQAQRYYVISQQKYPPVHFTYDIANEPLGDSGNVAFSAMQFILWTNPKRVFLVGMDTTSSYFDGSLSVNGDNAIQDWLQGWREFRSFASTFYPETSIISVNPIGLRGFFKDVYTKEYIKEHLEVKNYTLFEDYIAK